MCPDLFQGRQAAIVLRRLAEVRVKLLITSVVATVITALCCFTPVLVVLLGAVGLSALTGYLDYVLLPALAGFVVLTIYALLRQRKLASSNDSSA